VDQRGSVLGLPRRAFLQRTLGVATVWALGTGCQPGGSSIPAPTPAPPPAPGGPSGTAPAAPPSLVVAPRRSLKIAWTSVASTLAPIWVAHEMGAWSDLGLDVELLRIGSSSQMAAAMRAGEVDGGVLDWSLGFQFVAQGGNARMVAAITNRPVFSVISGSPLQPRELAGKRWGITRLGSATHTASLLALELWGLRPDDVNFIQLQDMPAILAGLQAAAVDVVTVSPPTNIRAVQAGFHELIDLAEAGPEYPSVGMCIVDRHVADSPDLVRAYVAGYGAGVARFARDREQALDVLRRYLQLDDEPLLLDTHARSVRYLASPPVLPMASLPRVRDELGQEDARVAALALTDVAAPQFADELAAQGYFARLT
jgi:ABC-type nitrate/sulfonate/bicarbonate transport system substrate-binding protein